MGCFIFGGGGGRGDSSLDFSQVNMEPQYALAGKKFYNKDKELKTGSILNWDGTPLTLADGETISGADVVEPSLSRRYIPSGKYLGKPVELAPMAQGSVTGAQLDAYSFRITKIAGYIEGGVIDYVIHSSSHAGEAADSRRADSSSIFYLYAADPTFSVANMMNVFAIYLFAHGSVSSGEIAAISIVKQADSSWGAMAYVSGNYPKIPSVSLGIYITPEGATHSSAWKIEITSTQGGDGQYCSFSTVKNYEGFFLYTN